LKHPHKSKLIQLIIYFISLLTALPIFSQDTSLINLKNSSENTDVKIFRCINNNRTDFLDKSLTITDKSVLPAAIILPAAMIIYGRANDKPYEENSGLLLALSEAVNFGLTFGIKNIVKRERPYETLGNVNYKNVSVKDKYSFPSNHTSTAFTIATTFALRYSGYPQIYVPMYLWGTIAGYGRIYWGMHYPSDVLGGAIIGSLSAITVYSFRSEIIKAKNNLLGEKNRPDYNELNSKTISVIFAGGIITSIFNEFALHSINNIQMQVQPFTKDGSQGLGFKISYYK
jgi:membrane-associated phospholipid phosphatase